MILNEEFDSLVATIKMEPMCPYCKSSQSIYKLFTTKSGESIYSCWKCDSAFMSKNLPNGQVESKAIELTEPLVFTFEIAIDPHKPNSYDFSTIMPDAEKVEDNDNLSVNPYNVAYDEYIDAVKKVRKQIFKEIRELNKKAYALCNGAHFLEPESDVDDVPVSYQSEGSHYYAQIIREFEVLFVANYESFAEFLNMFDANSSNRLEVLLAKAFQCDAIKNRFNKLLRNSKSYNALYKAASKLFDPIEETVTIEETYMVDCLIKYANNGYDDLKLYNQQ